MILWLFQTGNSDGSWGGWGRSGWGNKSLQVKKPIRLATCSVWLTGVSNSRPSSGKEDKLNTANTHKEAATGTEWNTASAYWDSGSSQE